MDVRRPGGAEVTDPHLWICPYCGLRGIAADQATAAIRGIHHDQTCKGDK